MAQVMDERPRSGRAERNSATHDLPRSASLLGDAGDELSVEIPRRKRSIFYLSPMARVRIVAALLTLFACATVLKLYSWQVTEKSFLQNEAARRILKESSLPARRGAIRDANGLLLASNIWVYNVYAAPQGLSSKQATRVSDKLIELLPQIAPDKIKAATTPGSGVWNLIAGAVDSATTERIRAAQLPGVFFEGKSRRIYPANNMLSQLLGFSNNEGQGAYGIEGFYDKTLRGQAGTRLAETDPDGNPIIFGQIELKPPVDGGDVTLTIDSAVQMIVERELKAGMEKHKADSAKAIVANPQTGEIIAWASFPNYNPNEFYKTDPALMLDPLVSGIYEPGSTFKILTAAIGIDTGAVTPDSAADLPGCVIKYDQTICNFDKVGYANQSVTKTLERSSNVGAMWIAEKFGPTKFYDYMTKFGIGQKTGIDLSAEGEGIVNDNQSLNWSPVNFLTSSFGQGIAATPLQVIMAVSAVANHGKLMKPYVVKNISRDGQTILENKPTFVRQVIKPESAKTTTEMLINAVRFGETRFADVKGYRIAGKTGTSTLYNSALTIGSTVAYAPADNPKFVVLVIYDKPKDIPWGSQTAAPVVKSITEQLLTYYRIPPTEPLSSTVAPSPTPKR